MVLQRITLYQFNINYLTYFELNELILDGLYDIFGKYFMYADGLGLGLGFGLGLDTNSISGHNNRHT
jgi:hypothetical protein